MSVTDPTGDRDLRVVVHRPVGSEVHPLLVLAHGLGADPGIFTETAEFLAARGYVVAAPEFPVTTSGLWEDAPDVTNQPGDVARVVDAVERRLGEAVDHERLGIVGHSLGGVTALLAGFHACCRDDGVDAVVAWAGGQLYGGDAGGYFNVGGGTPVLFIHGDADEVLEYQLGRDAYAAARPPKYLVTLRDGDHVGAFFLDDPYVDVVRETTLRFLDGHVKGEPERLERLPAQAEVSGVSEVIAEPA